jgi:hypothetical protein
MQKINYAEFSNSLIFARGINCLGQYFQIKNLNNFNLKKETFEPDDNIPKWMYFLSVKKERNSLLMHNNLFYYWDSNSAEGSYYLLDYIIDNESVNFCVNKYIPTINMRQNISSDRMRSLYDINPYEYKDDSSVYFLDLPTYNTNMYDVLKPYMTKFVNET